MQQLRPQTSTPIIFTRNETHSFEQKSSHIQSYRPKFYISKAQQDSNEQMMKGKMRDPPNSREFRKTIPNHMIQDKERLYEELNKTKQQTNHLSLENYQLRVQMKSLENVILKRSNNQNDEQPSESDIYRNSTLVAIPASQKKQIHEVPLCSVLGQLKKQIKDMRDQLEQGEEDMLRMKRMAKLTRIQEMEAELKSYKDETIRLKTMLHQQILRTANPTKTEQSLEDKYLQQQELITKLLKSKKELSLQLKKGNEEMNKQGAQYVDLEQNYQKSIKEKTQLKKDLQDLEEQFNKAQLNDPLFRRGQDVTQIKLELEKKVVENNQLKNETLIKDRKIHDLERSMKETINRYQEQLNAITKEKEIYKEKAEKQKVELIELQDKYQQLFFNSNRNLQQSQKIQYSAQSQEDLNKRRNSQDSIQQQQQSLGKGMVTEMQASEKQIPFKRKLQRKLSSIRQDDIEEIITQMRYKLRISNIRLAELELYLFHQNDAGEHEETTLGELIQVFQKKPFEMNQNESVMVSRYLIEPYGEKEITYNVNLSKENEEILSALNRAVGKYNIFVGDDKISIHEQIRAKLHEKYDDLMAFLKPKPIKGQSVNNLLPGNLCTRAQFKTALLQTTLDEEQSDVLFQTLYEITQEFNFIDLDTVWDTWPKAGQIKMARSKESQNRAQEELSPLVQQCLDDILDYAELHNLSIMDLRKLMDEDRSQYIDKKEFEIFLKKCNIELNETEFMLLVDHFDIEGDGRISVNDVGMVIDKASQARLQAIREQRSHKKTAKQILALVASHFIEFMNTHNQDLFQIFLTIDQDGQGSISKDEFKQMLRTKIIIPLDQEEYTEFFKLIDSSNDGQIHFKEFQQYMIPEIERQTGKSYHQHLADQQLKHSS